MNLKKANLKDSEFFYNLRNSTEARKYSSKSQLIKFTDHDRWFKKSLKNKKSKLFIIFIENQKMVGYLRVEQITDKHFVSINVDKNHRKKGIAYKALKMLENKHLHNENEIFANVRKNNIASKKLFFKVGYELFKQNKNFIVMKRKIKNFEVIDQIEKIRGNNNVSWMNLLRLAYKHSPVEASNIMKKIYRDDSKISKLVKKLIK